MTQDDAGLTTAAITMFDHLRAMVAARTPRCHGIRSTWRAAVGTFAATAVGRHIPCDYRDGFENWRSNARYTLGLGMG